MLSMFIYLYISFIHISALINKLIYDAYLQEDPPSLSKQKNNRAELLSLLVTGR